ncbi:MAG: methyltransferase domain-containing protein [ANME-2 cluster archaeon]|nr:methyltransferase domain-containing protein [ANME-2 cluster archaeon]MDF1531357.1 methyltransferase domain-containing protein [ANME-2 cluster archaeon]
MITKNIDFSDIASTYENSSLVQRSAADILLKLLDIKDKEDILDLGCGAGNLTRKIKTLTQGTVIGIDPSSGMIKEAMERRTGPAYKRYFFLLHPALVFLRDS